MKIDDHTYVQYKRLKVVKLNCSSTRKLQLNYFQKINSVYPLAYNYI